MRSVLAVDEVIAEEIAKKLPGEVERFGRMAMHDKKGSIIETLQAMLSRGPSVLAVGAKAWDPLPMLKRMRLPRWTPVVLLTGDLTLERSAAAADLDVFSIVPLDGSVSRISSAVAVELRLAEMWQAGFLSRPLAPVVVSRPRQEGAGDHQHASVFDLAAYRAAARSA